MAKKYSELRKWMESNPAQPPQYRRYFGILDGLVTWPDTTTTTASPTTTTAAPTTTTT